MEEQPGDRATSGRKANGAGAAEFAELRRLLIGEDLDRLAEINARLDDPARRSADVAAVLPDAIRAARARKMREALEPLFEKSFQSSVRKHPKELADAIYPVIGPAIRISILAAIRESSEALNQIIEKSVSWRAIRWRIEARVTGKSFTEILLARSLLYSVEQVFLIHRKSGVLLRHVEGKASVLKDADMIAGMLTAIQDFFSDSFTGEGQELETVDTGRYKLWIQYGPKALLAGAVSGTPPAELKDVFRSALDKIHETLFAELDTFQQGDLSVFEPANPYLEACLLGQAAPKKRRSAWPWLLLAGIILLVGSLVYFQVRNQQRWNRYFDALKQQPGVVVTGIEKHGSVWTVAGLKDPKAPDPPLAPGELELDPARIRYEWQPYLSLNTPYAAERDLERDRDLIEKPIIRFEMGKSSLPLAEAGHIETMADAIKRLLVVRPESRFTVTGRTDEVGTPEANATLSLDRAIQVRNALIALGVPAGQTEAIGLGDANTQPGGSEWEQAARRSVSLRITGGR